MAFTLFSSLRVPDPVFLIVTVSAGAFNSLFRRVDRQPRLVFLFGKRNCAERHGDVFLTQTAHLAVVVGREAIVAGYTVLFSRRRRR
ncbi:MAG: hypothetical protein WCC90_03535 [Methylocella sp.]